MGGKITGTWEGEKIFRMGGIVKEKRKKKKS